MSKKIWYDSQTEEGTGDGMSWSWCISGCDHCGKPCFRFALKSCPEMAAKVHMPSQRQVADSGRPCVWGWPGGLRLCGLLSKNSRGNLNHPPIKEHSITALHYYTEFWIANITSYNCGNKLCNTFSTISCAK